MPALISDGRYEYSWLGVSVTSLHPDLARAMELDPQQRGALVVAVQEGSPAARSGLQGNDRMAVIQGREAEVGGDVIIAINDRPIRNSDDLITYQVRHTRAGDVVKLTILRQGAVQTIEVTLGTRPRT